MAYWVASRSLQNGVALLESNWNPDNPLPQRRYSLNIKFFQLPFVSDNFFFLFCGKCEDPIRMKRLVEFGRQVMFYVRVLSGHEEQRIRTYRLKLDERLRKAEEKKEALKKLPDEVILGEVRNMVQQMQNLNKHLEETDAAIQDYLKPLDSKVEAIVDLQLKEEAKTMKTMLDVMKEQAFQEQAVAEKTANAHHSEQKSLKDILKAMKQQVLPEKQEAVKTSNALQEAEKTMNTDASRDK